MFDNVSLQTLREIIDWTPFFQSWELSGRYPQIFDDAVVGEQARSLFDDAQKMLDRIIAEKWLTAKAVVGIWPANSVGDDDMEFLRPSPSRGGLQCHGSAHFLRQQAEMPADRPDFCLADFIAPKDSGVRDWIGAFAVTAGLGIEPARRRVRGRVRRLLGDPAQGAGRPFCRGAAEHMHRVVRTDLWGFASDEALTTEHLIEEGYRGIRPAPAIRPAPTTARRRSCSNCSMPAPTRAWH